ncbi:protein tyrosine kinase domain-containing protein [Rhizoctonia solani AG-1 IA]|uniref:Protein tyrosine kinase domain-containing protein n=1 Tax=Thanatephorus cucumeris (strain AG1-IA) TaxID=983506 RepID=L8WNK1_THACA|nr:protein tyrosine kinase domain-containing protein [Rhizoctonia solani AG-1 IA]
METGFKWLADGQLLPDGAEPTVKADVWSLGMETFTGDIPYPELSELNALSAVADGVIPARPNEFINLKTGHAEIHWALLSICFQLVPGNRPGLNSVRDILSDNALPPPQIEQMEHVTIGLSTTLPTIIDRLVDQGCLNITKQLIYGNESHKYSGPLSDVYQARLLSGRLVAVKCLRALSNSESKPEKVFKRTARELYAWSVSTHPNVLEFVGLAVFRDKLAMVAPWMLYGSLLAFIDANPDYDRCRLCTQIAEGLIYIHGLGMDNVVVSNEGVAKITDFGSATMRRDFPVAFTATESISYSIRWAAGIRNNYETDVYALGMVNISDTYDVQLLTMKFFQTILNIPPDLWTAYRRRVPKGMHYGISLDATGATTLNSVPGSPKSAILVNLWLDGAFCLNQIESISVLYTLALVNETLPYESCYREKS